MNMKYFINFSDFEEFQDTFQKKLDEYNDEVYRLFRSSQEVQWVGLGRDKTMSALYTRIEALNKISENLNKFLEFMRIASNNYSDGVDEVRDKFKEIEDIINSSKFKKEDFHG